MHLRQDDRGRQRHRVSLSQSSCEGGGGGGQDHCRDVASHRRSGHRRVHPVWRRTLDKLEGRRHLSSKLDDTTLQRDGHLHQLGRDEQHVGTCRCELFPAGTENSFHNRRCSHEDETASGRMSRFRHSALGEGKRSKKSLQYRFVSTQPPSRCSPALLLTIVRWFAPAVHLARARSDRPARDLPGRGTDERPSAEMHDDGTYELKNQTLGVPGRVVASLTPQAPVA